MFNISIHIHKWVGDTQGAIFCVHCHKFRGWEPPALREWTETDAEGNVIHHRKGWGYELNGEEWKRKKEAEIAFCGGRYW